MTKFLLGGAALAALVAVTPAAAQLAPARTIQPGPGMQVHTRAQVGMHVQRIFARLDTNRDGRLSFEEWAVRTSEKFAEADANRDRSLNRVEYATTAPRRRPARRQNCAC